MQLNRFTKDIFLVWIQDNVYRRVPLSLESVNGSSKLCDRSQMFHENIVKNSANKWL